LRELSLGFEAITTLVPSVAKSCLEIGKRAGTNDGVTAPSFIDHLVDNEITRMQIYSMNVGLRSRVNGHARSLRCWGALAKRFIIVTTRLLQATPLYNEANNPDYNVSELTRTLLQRSDIDVRFLLIDVYSRDGGWMQIESLCQQSPAFSA
jgi:hypothetical protein